MFFSCFSPQDSASKDWISFVGAKINGGLYNLKLPDFSFCKRKYIDVIKPILYKRQYIDVIENILSIKTGGFGGKRV